MLHTDTYAEMDTALERRLLAGDPGALPELQTLLQARFSRRAASYLQRYRHLLPAYLDVQDLLQEAYLVVYKHLKEIANLDAPLSYLIASGYQAMRVFCLAAIREPQALSLDRPYTEDEERPFHEYIPSLAWYDASPNAQEVDYTALYHAIDQLPVEQRAVVIYRFGLYEEAPHSLAETARRIGKGARSQVCQLERRAYTALYFQLREVYSQYAQDVLARRPATRLRLVQASAQLQAQGEFLSARALRRAAGVSYEDAAAFVQEQRGTRQRAPQRARQEASAYNIQEHQAAWQRFDRAYAELQAAGRPITVKALVRQANGNRLSGGCCASARKYLQERGLAPLMNAVTSHQDAWQRLDQAYAELQATGQPMRVRTLSRMAGVSEPTARKYLREKAAKKTEEHVLAE
jgi:DNA-directed RNA polymerase specialized sigma24 family protein